MIDFFLMYGIQFALRLLDQTFFCKRGQTKCTTIQQYVNIYSGPDYELHFKYAAILNMCFVTFMYGLILPILFPIALLFFVLMYIIEKLSLTYFFRKPPMYDDKLNKSTLSSLKYAPVYMMAFSFWAFSN